MSSGDGSVTGNNGGVTGNVGGEGGERQSADVRLPNSRRVYAEGKTEGVRVPFREIALQPTRLPDDQVEENAPVRVYDTSGPWGDPSVKCDVRDGLPALRREWILARGGAPRYARAHARRPKLTLRPASRREFRRFRPSVRHAGVRPP